MSKGYAGLAPSVHHEYSSKTKAPHDPDQRTFTLRVTFARGIKIQGLHIFLDLQGTQEYLSVLAFDQNPAITADDKRQLIDTTYGAMSQMTHAGSDEFAAIGAASGQ